MDEIKIVPAAPTYSRPRRNHLGSGLIRLIFFLLTLIPTCIIAWRIDLVNQPTQPVVVQQPQRRHVEPQQPSRRRLPIRAPQSDRREPMPPLIDTPIVPDVERQPPSFFTPIEPTEPAEPNYPLEPDPPPTQLITLNLEKTRQREDISLNGNVRVIRVEGCRYSLNPDTGVPPLEITLDGPRPVTLSVELADGKLVITPTVVDNLNKKRPFTLKYIDNASRRATKSAQDAADGLAAMKTEHSTLKGQLNAPNGIPYVQYRAARAHWYDLDARLPQAEKDAAGLQLISNATNTLAQFARDLSGKCKIVLEASQAPLPFDQSVNSYENRPKLLTEQDLETLRASAITGNDTRYQELRKKVFDYIHTVQTIPELEHAIKALNLIDDLMYERSKSYPDYVYHANASILNSWIGDSVDAETLARKFNAAINSPPYAEMVNAHQVFKIHCQKSKLTAPQDAKSAANELFRLTGDVQFAKLAAQL